MTDSNPQEIIIKRLVIDGDLLRIKHMINSGIKSDLAVFKAIEYNKLEVLKYLHSIGADFHNSIEEVRTYANLNRSTYNITRHILSFGRDIPDDCMHLACMYGHLEIVQFLISIGINATQDNIHTAFKKGHLEVIKYLYSIGVKLDLAVHRAIQNNQIEVLKYLHSIDADFNNSIMEATECGNIDILKYLISIGQPVTNIDIAQAFNYQDHTIAYLLMDNRKYK